MMKPWIARTLRRSLLLAAMALGTQELLHRAIFAPAEFPPASVDRMIARTPEGSSREVSDSAAVARVVAFVRARGGWAQRPRQIHPSSTVSNATFYRGDVEHGWLAWTPRLIIVPAGDEVALIPLSPDEGAEFQRLMGENGE